MERVTIIHTSDLHNRLTPDLAERLRKLKEAHPGSLMLDSGDALWAGNLYWRPGGEPVLDLMNSVPYDAMCVGNREFHFLEAGMIAKTRQAEFPMLSANLRSSKSNQGVGSAGASPSRAYVVYKRGGIRIGVLGLSVPSVTERMLVKKVSAFYFDQPIAAAREALSTLRAESDLVVALTHIGLARDRELAEKVEGIDLILGGHTHAVTHQPERVRDTCILHHGFNAHYAGIVRVEIDSGRVNIADELIPLAKA